MECDEQPCSGVHIKWTKATVVGLWKQLKTTHYAVCPGGEGAVLKTVGS